MVWRFWIGSLMLLLMTAAIGAQEKQEDQKPDDAVQAKDAANSEEAETPPTPIEQYKLLIEEYKKAQADFFTNYRKAKTPEEKTKLAQSFPRADKYADKMLVLAKENLDEEFAADALIWIVANVRTGPMPTEAIDLIVEHFVESKNLGSVCTQMAYLGTPAAKKLLDAVLEKNPHRQVKAQALFGLANSATRSRPPSTEKAEALFQQLADEYGDVKAYRGTMGDMAKGYLFELRNLIVGKEAPDIEGEDIDGETFKLSEYRGKVVVLDFWGDW